MVALGVTWSGHQTASGVKCRERGEALHGTSFAEIEGCIKEFRHVSLGTFLTASYMGGGTCHRTLALAFVVISRRIRSAGDVHACDSCHG